MFPCWFVCVDKIGETNLDFSFPLLQKLEMFLESLSSSFYFFLVGCCRERSKCFKIKSMHTDVCACKSNACAFAHAYVPPLYVPIHMEVSLLLVIFVEVSNFSLHDLLIRSGKIRLCEHCLWCMHCWYIFSQYTWRFGAFQMLFQPCGVPTWVPRDFQRHVKC
jgi:hypothetical protein